jgi:hypothetical protein
LFLGAEEVSFFTGGLVATGVALEVLTAGFGVGLATAFLVEGLVFGVAFLAGIF